MVDAARFLIYQGQKFEKRQDQYKIVERIPNTLVLERLLVKHKITREKLLMKIIPNDAQLELKL